MTRQASDAGALALVLVVVVAALAAVAWRLQQGEALRETRATAFGQQAGAASLRAPSVPELWAFLYDEQFRWARPISVSPQVERVTLSQHLVLVEQSWVHSTGQEPMRVPKHRAYRRAGDGWVLPGHHGVGVESSRGD